MCAHMNVIDMIWKNTTLWLNSHSHLNSQTQWLNMERVTEETNLKYENHRNKIYLQFRSLLTNMFYEFYLLNENIICTYTEYH